MGSKNNLKTYTFKYYSYEPTKFTWKIYRAVPVYVFPVSAQKKGHMKGQHLHLDTQVIYQDRIFLIQSLCYSVEVYYSLLPYWYTFHTALLLPLFPWFHERWENSYALTIVLSPLSAPPYLATALRATLKIPGSVWNVREVSLAQAVPADVKNRLYSWKVTTKHISLSWKASFIYKPSKLQKYLDLKIQLSNRITNTELYTQCKYIIIEKYH